MKLGQIVIKKGQEKRRGFVELFEKFQNNHSNWQVWQDFVYTASAAIAQTCDFRQEREDEYLRIIGNYNDQEKELFPKMLDAIVNAFETERFADILGDMYMQLDLGDRRKGQYFTPYNVCLMMAKMLSENPADEIKKRGFTTVGDPCCGGGALLIAFAQNCFEQGVNYQRDVLSVGQDVDQVVARMAFIQLSLLGCPGYVVIISFGTPNLTNLLAVSLTTLTSSMATST